ncbi:MAG: OmpA family protein [Gammaproteobacteria bacterium]|nr:OmpA family protein [Gammaproteobacteria bacterium]
MNIKTSTILTGLLGLLYAGAVLTGCASDETRDDSAEPIAEVEVIQGDGSGVIASIGIVGASMFDFDSAKLNDDGIATIEAYRKSIGPELTDAYMVVIVGHTDSSGDPKYNLWLSKERAKSVAEYLVSTGVNENQIRIIGRGAKEPIAANETREGRMQNRRVDILVVAEVRSLDALIFPSVALFERKSAELTEQGKALLEENRQEAMQLLQRATFIEIIGHTDSKGDEKDNMSLSMLRAASVRDYLISKGHDASKMITTGMGETDPVASNDTKEGRAQNRRVEILVLGRLEGE